MTFPLYVVQQDTKLQINNRRLQVTRGGDVLSSSPLSHISQIVIFGNVGLTTPAIGALLDKGIEIVFLTRNGRYRGRLVGSQTPHVPIRRAQYTRLDLPAFSLTMAKGFVNAKLSHQRALLQRHNRKHLNSTIDDVIDRLQKQIKSIERRTAISALLGLEGSATAAYFRGFRELIDTQWGFERRNRRPPRDPVNVLFSFGYTLLTQLAVGAIQASGLDVYAGFLHEYVYNRPALALDLAEEFRPVVDGIVLWCLNSGQITPEDFSPGPSQRPIVLGDQGKGRFIRAFEERFDQHFTHPGRGQRLPMRQCLHEQARQIVVRVKENNPGYQGMGFR
jgi:CRISPR-associated protein Cas1